MGHYFLDIWYLDILNYLKEWDCPVFNQINMLRVVLTYRVQLRVAAERVGVLLSHYLTVYPSEQYL